MVTPDFEDWLRRQDIPVEDTTTIDKYTGYLADEIGLKGGTLKVAEAVYREQYEIWGQLDITPFAWHTTIAGEKYRETRYAIAGIPGAWGRESVLLLGESIAAEMGLRDVAELVRGWYETEFG